MKTVRLEAPHPTAAPNTVRIDIPSSEGQGGGDLVSFSSGLQLMMIDWKCNAPCLFQGVIDAHSLGFSFCLEGRFDYHPYCFDRPLAASAGKNCFFSFPRTSEFVEKTDDRRMVRICLMLDGDHLARLTDGDEDRFYPMLKSLDLKSACRIGNTTTPVMKAALSQILHCPYGGMTRQIFLEGKAMELLAHKLDQITPSGCSTPPSLKNSDIERVNHAARLLVDDLENPPDIMTLTRLVGLNRNKLHRCFRSVFGLSPFEYLRKQRLQTAMLLLQDSEVNVTEAALMVGYTNLSYFAKAFKSMFGIAPSELRESHSSTFV